MSYRTLLPGRAYRFLYPSINFKCLISGLEERKLLVVRIRDTDSEPVDEETVNTNPFLNRGRLLVTGIDLDKNEERSFYVESMIAVMDIKTQIAVQRKKQIARLTESLVRSSVRRRMRRWID